ncbi:hypothetical protein [Natronospira bacteriovora]|uniref:Uncharacterized protein n=1 Tax=Natronospira bacteriovora TaxID=3069753 RepID=A0ABU0W7U2_9GAMM|nr:hypothetical protein [Natronospira sp. AB-CW4]MDQ2070107.1 hypothetical protein [Natronospira sp. AB-CW4]
MNMIREKRTYLTVLAGSLALGLSGCLSSSSDSDSDTTPEPDVFTVAGDLSGLGPGSLTLSFNGEAIVLDEDGSFTVADGVEEGTDFEFEVSEAPADPYQACDVSPASGVVNDDVNVTVTCLTPVKVSGRLSLPDPEDTTVTLHAGDESFNANADADGEFVLEADLADAWGFLRVETAEGEIHFLSEIGTLPGLLDNRDIPVEDDRNQLGESVTGRVNLNALNTAISGQLSWFNDHQAFVEHEELVDAGRRLLSQEAANVGGALRMVAYGEIDLPEWADNTLDVAVMLPEALEWLQEIREAEEGASSSMIASTDKVTTNKQLDIHSEPGMQAGEPKGIKSGSGGLDDSTASAMGEATVSDGGFTAVPEFLFTSGGHSWGRGVYASKLDFLASEVWMRETNGWTTNGIYSLSGGDLVMDFAGSDPIHVSTYGCEDENGDMQVCEMLTYYEDARIERIMDGLAGDLVRRFATTRREFPDDPNRSTETGTSEIFVSLMTRDDNIELDVDQVPGTLAMSLPPERYWDSEATLNPPRQVSDLLSLATGGTGSMQLYGDDLVWDVRSDGQLEIRPSGASERFEGWLIEGSADGEGVMIVESRHDESAMITADIVMRKDPNLFMNLSDIEGQWELWKGQDLHFDSAWILDYNRSNDPDIAHLGNVVTSDTPETSWAVNNPWSIAFAGDAANPVIRLASCLENTPDGMQRLPIPFLDDPNNAPADCDLFVRTREWQIIREEDGRLYMTEQQRWVLFPDGNGDWGEWETIHDTIRYYEYVGDAEY